MGRGLASPALPLAALVLALAWGGPLLLVFDRSFTGHMVMHMGVVALAAPLLAIALGGTRLDPTRRFPQLLGPVVASGLEFIAIWGWHAPAPHQAARGAFPMLVLEQGSFLLAALLVWLSCLGAGAADRRPRQAAGIVGLLLTSMHMTLLGALIALAPRPLYDHPACLGLTQLEDQSLGGVVMLLAGGGAYLAGGLWLAARLLRDPAEEATR
ncbi:cytochrome c oxidase assembly protein [Roseomonas sp. M0104]|uniref:Cytochrome c oxidase assembly protein n=1 Tax=Teichococcus coralli TaxID=2545983 RepID=A0A845BLW4_9PROT|nr:cytochrome c oxidase assembly protein [Pseudoroseomonas coralli]MXP64399.1 cytochrome c oxidase assembly protein [Pseudoroseomonas coralli]